MDAALTTIDEWLTPAGGLATGVATVVGLLTVSLGLIVPFLVWRAGVWSKRGARSVDELNTMLKSGQLKREKPEDAVTRALRERELEIVTKPTRPSGRAPAPDPDDPAEDDRGLPRWRAYGFDMETGMRTSVIVLANSVKSARREAEIRGVEGVSMVERVAGTEAESA